MISEFHLFSCFAEVLQRHSKGDKTSDKYCKIACIQWLQWSPWRWSNNQSLQWSSPFCKHEWESCCLASTGDYCRRVWSLSRACQTCPFFEFYLFHRWWQLALELEKCWVSAELSFSGVVLSSRNCIFNASMQHIIVSFTLASFSCFYLCFNKNELAFMSCLSICSFRCILTLGLWSSRSSEFSLATTYICVPPHQFAQQFLYYPKGKSWCMKIRLNLLDTLNIHPVSIPHCVYQGNNS